jgi:hypothetical protein
MPHGVRPRQLRVRTLLLGILLAFVDRRPAHLASVHRALVALAEPERRRLGVEVTWRRGLHLLTYRQVERTFFVLCQVLTEGDTKSPSVILQSVVDLLLEASISEKWKQASSSYAVDWTDIESFSSQRTKDGDYSDQDASWGHRKGGGPGERDELFFGYYLQAATMVRDEGADRIPELVRRMTLNSCAVDPPPQMVGVLTSMVSSGVAMKDVLVDSGYASRKAERFALPIRRTGAELVMDLHPFDRGTRGTYQGAICSNGSLYCPATPKQLLEIKPLAHRATPEQINANDAQSDELSRYKLGVSQSRDDDGYMRVRCPATLGKLRCPRRENSMSLGYDRPEISSPPDPAPPCCEQITITVAPEVNAKTAQKHDWPSKAHRLSFSRRTAVERTFSTIKDPATTDVSRGWCKVMGLTPMAILLACALVTRNLRVEDAFERHLAEEERRQKSVLTPRRRKRRRRTIDDLVKDKAPGSP